MCGSSPGLQFAEIQEKSGNCNIQKRLTYCWKLNFFKELTSMDIKLRKIMLRNIPKFRCREVSTVPLKQVPHLFCDATSASSPADEQRTQTDCAVYVIITNLFQIKFKRACTSNQVIISWLIRTTLYTKYFMSSCFHQKTNSQFHSWKSYTFKIFYRSSYIHQVPMSWWAVI